MFYNNTDADNLIQNSKGGRDVIFLEAMYFLLYSLFLDFKTSDLIRLRFIMQKTKKEQFLVNRQKRAKDMNHTSFNYE